MCRCCADQIFVGPLSEFLHHVLGVIRLVDLHQNCSISNLVFAHKSSWSSLLEILSCGSFSETRSCCFSEIRILNFAPFDLVPK
jgi:hypothetical protein